VVLGYAGLLARAVQLQALDAGWLAQRAQAQHRSTLRLGGLRGEILDRHGEPLAMSTNVESVAASPHRISKPHTAAVRMARVLRVRHEELEERLRAGRSFVWVKRWVTPDEGERIRRLDLEGVDLAGERRRLYPNRDLAAAYLGFAGRDEVGLSGLEFAFDGALRGEPSAVPARRDVRGRKLVAWEGDPERPTGARLMLTLDAGLQHVAERALDRALVRTGAPRGILVALDPWSGDLRAVAERPGFDPNRFWRESPRRFRARAFTDPFEPGSTLKPFLFALALEAKTVPLDKPINCENGAWRVADRTIHDWRPHGMLRARDVLVYSSNIGAGKIGMSLGGARLISGLRRFGFGERSGSGFPGESPGVVHSLRANQTVELATLSFGQGISTTAIQLAAAGATLANGGFRVRPRMARRIESPMGRYEWPSGRGERILPEEVAREVLGLLREVVERGTGRQALVSGIPIAGKTGTAQKVVDGGYARDRFVASFLGFVPARSPRLVVVVVLDEPVDPHTGGGAAAPVFRDVVRNAVGQLDLGAGEAG
jgi:cell division protein FtsI (penicillin-binding protein 3)